MRSRGSIERRWLCVGHFLQFLVFRARARWQGLILVEELDLVVSGKGNLFFFVVVKSLGLERKGAGAGRGEGRRL